MLNKLESSLFFLTLLLLPTQLGRHFWPSFSSIYSLPVDYLSPTIYLWDIIVVLLAAVSFRKRLWQLPLTLVGIFLITQLLSLFSAMNPAAGLVRFEQLFICALFGLYLSQQNFVSLVPKLSLPLLIGFLAEVFLALLQFLTQRSIGLWILGERTFSVDTPSIAKFNLYNFEFLRPYATFPHPNVLSAYVLIVAVLLYFLLDPRFRKWLILLSGGTILLAFSRAAWVIGAFWISKKLLRYWIFALILLPIAVVHFYSVLNYGSLSFLRREELNTIGWTLFVSHPLTGVGLNNFIPEIAQNSSIAGPSRFLQPVHNIELLLLAETGVIGLIGFLVLVLIPVYGLWKRRKSMWSKILLGLWLTIAWLGLFDHYFLTLPQGLRLLFLVWGLSMLQLNSGNSSENLRPSRMAGSR